MIQTLYIASTEAALLTFIINYIKCAKYLRSIGEKPSLNPFTLLMCFVPVLNIYAGLQISKGIFYTREELQRLYEESEVEDQ